MKTSFPTRRAWLALAAAGAVAPVAWAGPGVPLPARLHYARVTPEGLRQPPLEEQDAWLELRARTGELVTEIEPLPVGGLLGIPAPETDGGAGCILAARQIAIAAGASHILLYATDDGRRDYPRSPKRWRRVFDSLRADYGPHDAATGEAHVLDTYGGGPLLSVVTDAKPRMAWNPLDPRNPESEAMQALVRGIERRLVDASRASYASARSIAD